VEKKDREPWGEIQEGIVGYCSFKFAGPDGCLLILDIRGLGDREFQERVTRFVEKGASVKVVAHRGLLNEYVQVNIRMA
jgi:hypothetical protein